MKKWIHMAGILLLAAAGGAKVEAQPTCFSTDLSWSTMAVLPTTRDRLALGDVNGILYAVGGQNGSTNTLATVEAYNPATNSWSTKTAMPTGREDLAVATVNGILYAIGGGNGSTAYSTVEAYNPSTNGWTTGLSAMPTARCNLAVGVVGGIIYAVGGNNASGNPVTTVEAYNPATDSWSTKMGMPVSISQFVMGVLNGKIYVVGGDPNFGFISSAGATNTVESYDPSANTWTSGLAPVPTAVENAASGVMNGVFYVMGGAGNGPYPGIINGVQAYDAGANSWTVESPMPNIQSASGGDAVNGVLYSIGGWSGSAFMNADQQGRSACTPTITPSPTPTLTPTITPTPTITSTPSYLGSNPPVPGQFFIYPSPATGSQASVSYNMAQPGQADLRVWNEKAELVTHVIDSKSAGVQVTPFSIAGFGSGVYFYSLTLTYSSGQVEKLGPKKFAILH